MPDGKASRAGRWHSSRWWTGHHDDRDDCGQYADHAGASCNRDGAGRGERRLHAKLAREHARAERDREQRKRKAAKTTRAGTREDVDRAKYNQEMRAEAYAGTGKRTAEEQRAFYGSDKVAQSDSAERRLTTAQADKEARARTASDREEAARHRKREQLTRAAKAAETHAYFREMENNGW